MDTILNILAGGIGGAIIAWLLRTWISERLKQSIAHEYSQKLESYKAELNGRLQDMTHQNQLFQLRTSLFFDHQRNAFSSLVSKMADVKQKWIEVAYDEYEGMTESFPYDLFKELKTLYF